jgi:hypothetical protein
VGNGVISTQRCQRTTNWQKKTREAHYLFEAVIRNAIIYWSPNHSFGSVTLAMTVEHMSFRGNYCLSLTPGAWLIVSLSTHNHLKKAKLDYVEYQVRVLNKKKFANGDKFRSKHLCGNSIIYFCLPTSLSGRGRLSIDSYRQWFLSKDWSFKSYFPISTYKHDSQCYTQSDSLLSQLHCHLINQVESAASATTQLGLLLSI